MRPDLQKENSLRFRALRLSGCSISNRHVNITSLFRHVQHVVHRESETADHDSNEHLPRAEFRTLYRAFLQRYLFILTYGVNLDGNEGPGFAQIDSMPTLKV